MSSYRNSRRDEAVADDYLANHAPCRWCGNSTPRDDLSRYGARCEPCYQAWCAEANPSWWPNRPLQPHEREALMRHAKKAVAKLRAKKPDPRAWAHALKAREEAGERLSPVQRDAWRIALRLLPSPIEDVPAQGDAA